MINFISAITELGIGEALIILVLGMVVIFVTLAVLIGCLYVIRYIVNGVDTTQKAAPKNVEPQPAPQPVISAIEEDEETVAAITAAIACILQEEAKGETIVAPFRIKKIKHIH